MSTAPTLGAPTFWLNPVDVYISTRPLGLSLYPAISGGCVILRGGLFRTKLAYIPLLKAW